MRGAALAVLLLIGGGLLIDSFARMRRTDLGIDASRVLTFWLRPSEVRVPVSAAPAFVAKILEAIERVPGVEAARLEHAHEHAHAHALAREFVLQGPVVTVDEHAITLHAG